MSKKNDNQKLIKIPLPEDVFDVPGASVSRSKRVSHKKVAEIRQLARKPIGDELLGALAQVFPEWIGVINADTGEALSQPCEDQAVFLNLDYAEQLPWFIKAGLAYAPNQSRETS